MSASTARIEAIRREVVAGFDEGRSLTEIAERIASLPELQQQDLQERLDAALASNEWYQRATCSQGNRLIENLPRWLADEISTGKLAELCGYTSVELKEVRDALYARDNQHRRGPELQQDTTLPEPSPWEKKLSEGMDPRGLHEAAKAIARNDGWQNHAPLTRHEAFARASVRAYLANTSPEKASCSEQGIPAPSEEAKRLRSFVEGVVEVCAWGRYAHVPIGDGGSVQDWATKLGILVPVPHEQPCRNGACECDGATELLQFAWKAKQEEK